MKLLNIDIILVKERRMKMPINTIIVMILLILLVSFFGYIITLIIRVMRRYINQDNKILEEHIIKESLSEILKKYRIERKMTQEFVAEKLGVSRQAVSKWESGISEPSTSNLLALANLYNISAEELLKGIEIKNEL